MIEQLCVTGLARRLPVDGDRFLCAYSSFAIARNDTNEVAVAHDDDAGHRFGGFGVTRDELRFDRRWSEYTAIQHSLALDVRRVLMFTVDEIAAINFGNRRACHRP